MPTIHLMFGFMRFGKTTIAKQLERKIPAVRLTHDKENCIVIGDSLNDFAAAQAAGIQSIAFVGAEGNDTSEYRQKCLDAGVITVCASMQEVSRFLNHWLSL